MDWETDMKHRWLLLERFGLDGGANALSVNGDWGDSVATICVEQDAEVLFPEEDKEFRATVERLDCLGQDSRGVQFPAKALPSEMAKPTTASWWRRKKVVRILVARKRARVVWRFPWQSVEEAAQLKVIMDADWSGDQRSREIGLELYRSNQSRMARERFA